MCALCCHHDLQMVYSAEMNPRQGVETECCFDLRRFKISAEMNPRQGVETYQEEAP